MNIHIYNATISNEEYVKLLGVNFEDRLNFGFHVSTLLILQRKGTTFFQKRAIAGTQRNDVFL